MTIIMCKRHCLIVAVLLPTLAAWPHWRRASAQPPGADAPAISIERLRADVKHLASDRLEGRGIGTLAEERTIDYIAAEFAKAGLKPAGERGGYSPG
jgi:hypothetical protein